MSTQPINDRETTGPGPENNCPNAPGAYQDFPGTHPEFPRTFSRPVGLHTHSQSTGAKLS